MQQDWGGPAFKTQKTLGGRSLVSDTFSRGFMDTCNQYESSYNSPYQPGKGEYAHRDGYNVLYGDSSAKWYGDPQQRIMWDVATPTTRGARYIDYATASWARYREFSSGYKTYPDNAQEFFDASSWSVWHRFDGLNGIDVATAPNWDW